MLWECAFFSTSPTAMTVQDYYANHNPFCELLMTVLAIHSSYIHSAHTGCWFFTIIIVDFIYPRPSNGKPFHMKLISTLPMLLELSAALPLPSIMHPMSHYFLDILAFLMLLQQTKSCCSHSSLSCIFIELAICHDSKVSSNGLPYVVLDFCSRSQNNTLFCLLHNMKSVCLLTYLSTTSIAF